MSLDDEYLLNVSMLAKDGVFSERQKHAYSEETPSASNRSRTYDLPNTSTDDFHGTI